MEEVYDLHQHTHCVLMHIRKKEIAIAIVSTSNRYFRLSHKDVVTLDSFKKRTNVTNVSNRRRRKAEEERAVDSFRDRLYELFKKDRETWNEEDNLLMKKVSNHLSLEIRRAIKANEPKIENFDLFHYVFVVPSEWEEEMREDILRPIFVQSGLISDQDHRDRLLFFTDIEAICYHHSFKRGENTILYRVSSGEDENIIKFDLIQTTTTLYNIPNAHLFPKVKNSSSLSLTKGDIGGRIKEFLREKLFPVVTEDGDSARNLLKPELNPSDQNQIIEAIIEGINGKRFPSLADEEKDKKEEPWIIFKNEWMLSDSQKEFIKSLRPSIICAEIGVFLLDYMKDIISNNFTKIYSFLLFHDTYTGAGYGPKNDITWLKYMLEYNSRSLNFTANPVVHVSNTNFILEGGGIAAFEAIQHSDMYCNPRIVSSVDLSTSSSVFLNSKPDAIINLDISLKSTLLTCSILDEDGLIQHIYDHDYLIGDKHLPPLGNFYTFSDTPTLTVREQFIPFAERYSLGDLRYFVAGNGDSINEDLLFEIKALLTNDLSDGVVLVSTDNQKHIKAFILMYMIYIKEDILSKLPDQLISDQMNLKIGYAVSIEAMLLNKTIESKDNLRDIIYASELVPKDDCSKKLRIAIQGEGVLAAIQKSLELELSLRSYFLLCQLHEDYIQLSLHQVVTASRPEVKEQESIIVQDETLAIQNIYDSLCSSIWCNLPQDNRLIERCEIHCTSDNNEVLGLFSSNIKTEFFTNLKRHISDNVLQSNSSTQSTDTINLTSSCNCKLHLTISDIIDISFRPVLQDIACVLSASLLNKEIFGNYMNIDYLFSFIRFNNNPQLQYAFTRILEEEAEDFNLELGIDTSCLVVPELFSQLLQPAITQQPFCYKDFKIGALQQVCNENYAIGITQNQYQGACPIYKSKITDTKAIKCDYDIAFPFLNKGVIINNAQQDRKFYLHSYNKWAFTTINIEVYRLKEMNYLEDNETISLSDNIYQQVGGSHIYFDEIFKRKDVDVPVIVFISYISYTSSLQFSVKIAGASTKVTNLTAEIETGEPLTLTRL